MMNASPALIDLILELHRLGASDRKVILGRLDEEDRELVIAQLRRIERRSEPSFDALASLSPWLAESLAAARSGDHGLTGATCESLLDAERLLPANPGPRASLTRRLTRRKAVA